MLNSIDNIDKIEIFDAIGKKINTITNINSNSFIWNGIDQNGRTITAGIYFVKIYSGLNIQNSKLIKL